MTTTRYLLDGRQVPKGTPGARKTPRRSRHWYGVGLPGQPATRRVKLSTDKAAARRMLDDLVRGAERGRAGLPDDAETSRPLADHLANYAEALMLGLAGGKSRRAPSSDHAAIAARYPVVIFSELLGYESAAAFGPHTPTAVAQLLRDRSRRKKPDGGWSAQTCNNHLAGCKRFVRWLAAKRVPVASDLLDNVPTYDAENHRTRARRECCPEELGRVLAATRAGGVSYALTGEQRYMLYVTAWGTGFRAAELSRLVVGQFDFESEPAALTIQGRGAKNRKRVRQPLPPDVSRELQPWLAGRDAVEPVWPSGSWSANTAQMLAGDLEAAGVAYRTETPDGPAFLDFHSLRHTYVTTLARTGIGVAELQKLARHSDPRLTMGVYVHASDAALTAAVGKMGLPGVTAAPDITLEQVATLAALLGALFGAILGPSESQD